MVVAPSKCKSSACGNYQNFLEEKPSSKHPVCQAASLLERRCELVLEELGPCGENIGTEAGWVSKSEYLIDLIKEHSQLLTGSSDAADHYLNGLVAEYGEASVCPVLQPKIKEAASLLEIFQRRRNEPPTVYSQTYKDDYVAPTPIY